MDNFVLPADLFVNLARKAIFYFINNTSKQNPTDTTKSSYVDIKLQKDENFYTLEISYNLSCSRILKFCSTVFSDIILSKHVSMHMSLGSIFIKSLQNQAGLIYEIYFAKKKVSLRNSSARNEIFNNSFSWKECLSFKPKFKITANGVRRLKKDIIDEIRQCLTKNASTIFSFHCDKQLIFTNQEELANEYKLCELLSDSLVKIIRQSVNNEFREECFRLLQVNNSYEAKRELTNRLLTMLK